MPKPFGKPTLHDHSEEELEISVEALAEIMQAVLARGSVFHFRARGISMSPFIKSGDDITIAPPSLEKPAVGKVAAYIQPETDHLVVHRIIARQGAVFLIQGDNVSDQAGDWVSSAEVLGCVTRIKRSGRPVRLGLGPERYLIAFLARTGILEGVLLCLRWVKHFQAK